MSKKTYAAKADGFIIGTFYRRGEPVALTADQAKYLTPPYGDAVGAVEPQKPDKKEK